MVNFDSHNNPELPEPDQLEEPHLNGNQMNDTNGGDEGYEGYELLGQEMEIPASDDDSESDSEDEFRMETDGEPLAEDTPVVDNGPQIEKEIEAEVWNAPRPDEKKKKKPSSVMANIKLPTNAIPDWGVSIPEEQWKQNLLQKIRARQSGPANH